jgi:hypothetical protein
MVRELSLSLANTLSNDRPEGDLLMNVRDLREWLVRNELPMRVASAGELQHFRDLRTVVRDLFAARAMASRPTARTLAAINAWSALAPRAPRAMHRCWPRRSNACVAVRATAADFSLWPNTRDDGGATHVSAATACGSPATPNATGRRA